MYRNINGKEEKIEKEFDNVQDYQNFLEENHEKLNTDFVVPKFGDPFYSYFDELVNDIFDQRFGLDFAWWFGLPEDVQKSIDFDKYHKEAKKLKHQESKKEDKIKKIKKTIRKLKAYHNAFQKAKKDDLVKSIEHDIHKLEKELEKL